MKKDEFERIIDHAIEESQLVDCDLPAYADGLRTMIERLQERLQAVEEEIG